VFLTGAVAAGLYLALTMFPPPGGEISSLVAPPANSTTEKKADNKKVSRPPATSPKKRKPIRPTVSPPEPVERDESIYERPRRFRDSVAPRPRPFSRGMRRRGDRPGRSKALRNARRAIFREGTEPDWDQFEGREKEMLERAWERYQKRQDRTGERRAREE